MPEDNRVGKLHMPGGLDLRMTRMTAVERLSEPFSIVIDATSATLVDLHAHLTDMVGIEFVGETHVGRWFHGMLWEYVELGASDKRDEYRYRITLRPALEAWTLNRASIIFSKMTATDLIDELGGAWVEKKLGATAYPRPEYRVQYNESNFDFLSRSIEKEGIYYFYDHSASQHTINFIDDANLHPSLVPEKVALFGGDPASIGGGVLSSLVERRGFAPTKYVADDYDYTAPTYVLKKEKTVATLGKRPPRFAASVSDVNKTAAPWYEYPAGFDQPTADSGERYATIWLDRERRAMARSFAEGNVFAAAVGRKIIVDFAAASGESADAHYLIVATTHRYSAGDLRSGSASEDLTVELELMPVELQYRPARRTPVPRIQGPQTAIVIGPSGEEIYTDKYGRVKVQFFWDRSNDGEPEPRSIWVRVGQSGAGSGFGAFMIPRIGHEVIVEFLDGDPDRPIITGAVYNGSNLPAFGDAADNTVQGIRTNSSKGGGGYNEIRIDDKADAELFSLHAQKDLKWVVDKGDETRDLNEGSRTTTIHKGDETLTITKGKRTTKISGNETTTIESGNVVHEVSQGDVTRTIKTGKRTTEIMGDDVKTIKTGDHTTTISTGNRETKIDVGNDKLTLSVGNVEIKLSLGSHKTEALQSIELKCGMSTFKMDPMSIEIKSMMVKIEGSLMFQTKGLMVQQEASAIHIVKGAMVMIN